MSKAIDDYVRQRAGNACEYCQMPQAYDRPKFEIDHVVAEQHHGKKVEDNLALACYVCNHHKGPNLAGIDLETGKKTWLFDPRRQKWQRHFRWEGPILFGRTAVGRATIDVLGINLPLRVELREELIDEGLSPYGG